MKTNFDDTKTAADQLNDMREAAKRPRIYDEDSPPTTKETLEWCLYMQKKYKTRRISKELIEQDKKKMTPQQRAAYDYSLAKDIYIWELLKKYGDMTPEQLEQCMKEHPYYEYYSQEEIDRRERAKSAAESTQAVTANG